LVFLFQNLHDETNRFRDRPSIVRQPETKDGGSLAANAMEFWRNYQECNDSLVTKYWSGVEATVMVCNSCGHQTARYEAFDQLFLSVNHQKDVSLDRLFQEYCAEELLDDYKCDHCKATGTKKRDKLARLPDRLVIGLRRFTNIGEESTKDNAVVTFPIRGLDLTPYSVQAGDSSVRGDADHNFRAPFIYDCYAAMMHGGTLRGGHYRAFVKGDSASDPYLWYHINDERVEPVKIGSTDPRDMTNQLYSGMSQSTAYQVFYQRRET
jgi:ubiquitin carboxyl-terminal hydrolase 8